MSRNTISNESDFSNVGSLNAQSVVSGSVTCSGSTASSSLAVSGALSAGSASVSGALSAGSATVSGALAAGLLGGATGKKIKWIDAGVSDVQTYGSLEEGSNGIVFNSTAPSGTLVVIPIPSAGSNLNQVTYGLFQLTNTGCQVATRNTTTDIITGLQYSYVAFVTQ